MKKLLIIAALLPTLAWGSAPTDAATDTTIVYKDTQVEVENVDGETRVTIYNKRGNALTKVRETTYVDGNEVEKVFVGSPFASHGTLQTDRLHPTLPTVWWAQVLASESVWSNKTDNIHTKKAGSFEIGLTPYSHCFALNQGHTCGLTTGVQAVYTRQSYGHGYILSMSGDRVAAGNDNGQSAKHSYMQYFGLRVPLLVTLDCSGNRDEAWAISLGLDVEWRINGSYKWTGADNAPEICNDIHLNHWGIGVVEQLKCGPMVISGRIGVTPLYKTPNDKKMLSGSFGIGFDLWECIGRKH